MIAISLQLDKINRTRIFTSEKTKRKYLSLVLIERPDDYGNAGYVAQSVSREERLSGDKGEICGNWRHVGDSKPNAPIKPTSTEVEDLF